jgi:hypothetical protein
LNPFKDAASFRVRRTERTGSASLNAKIYRDRIDGSEKRRPCNTNV